MAAALSLMVAAVLALVAGAAFLLRRGGMRGQALLMLVLAAVIALNVAIWTAPDQSGAPPLQRRPE